MYLGGGLHWLGRHGLPMIESLFSATWSHIALPDSRPSIVRSPGRDPDRILLTGSASAVGWGVLTHEMGLAGYLARLTPALTMRGLGVEVVAGPTFTVREVTSQLTPHTISRYDAIVLTLGSREAFEFMPVALWEAHLNGLLDQIERANSDPPGVLVVGAEESPPAPMAEWFARMVMRRSHQINAASQKIVAKRTHVRYVDSAMLPAPGGSQSMFDADRAELYTRAAQAIVPTLAELLQQAHKRQTHAIDDEGRRDALAYLATLTDIAPVGVELTRLRRLLGVRSVDLYLVDHDMVRTVASTSVAPGSRERADAISSMAIEYRNGLVVNDTLFDSRFSSLAAVTGPPHIRFYAAHPVESPDGHRVALLSVVHDQPLEFGESEIAVVRKFAIQVGALLFADY